MRELAFLNQGLTISPTDLREQVQDEEGNDLGHRMRRSIRRRPEGFRQLP